MSIRDSDTQDDTMALKPQLQSELSSNSLFIPSSQYNGRLSPTYAADATTAVTLENVDQAGVASSTEPERHQIQSISLSRYSMISNESFEAVQSSGEEDNHLDTEENTLSNMLHGLMVRDLNRATDHSVASLSSFNIFSDDCTSFDENFVRRKILFDKLDGNWILQDKLKQFFILSTAGKPIYSLNGSEDVILGYMGLLTTIVSTFQESMKTEFHHISQDGFRMVVMNKSPLLFVAMSKVPQELVPSTGNTSSTAIIENQLKILYNYLLAVLSKPVITKNFEKRMNYDLRRILSSQDFHVLDTLSMSLTYGFSITDEDKYQLEGAFYLSSILGNAIQCAKISNTSRTKLNAIMLLSKKLKLKEDSSEGKSLILSRFLETDKGRSLASDLLFGLLLLEDKIISYMKPKNHDLTNEDLHTLLSTISASYKAIYREESADLWIPLCMPKFNSSGFLYLFIKKFKIGDCAKPVTIALLSGSKNSFFDTKDVAEYIIHKIVKSKSLSKKLSLEFSQSGSMKDVFKQLGITLIKHFIFKGKSYNQIYMDDIFPASAYCDISMLKANCHILHFYSALATSKATIVKQGESNPKKLSYTRWQLGDEWVTGFMLADEKFEFYCLCGGLIQAQEIIDQSLRLVKWCQRYKRRLFVGNGVTF